MFNIVLVRPEIPPNTGNVIRLSANTGCALHLIEPLGFSMDDKHMKRAGLDYHEYTSLHRHADWATFLHTLQPDLARIFAFTTRGSHSAFNNPFRPGDWLVFGSETSGLPEALRDHQRVFARTGGPGREGIACFIVDTDTPGFFVRRIVHTLRNARPATEIELDDARVPHANVLGEVNRGFGIANDRLSRNRIPYAASCTSTSAGVIFTSFSKSPSSVSVIAPGV